MSSRAVNWAKVQSAPSVVAKAVLVCLADYANEVDLAWPAIKKIAAEVQVHARTVQRALTSLEEEGLLVRSARMRVDGGQGTNAYLFPIPDAPPAGCHPPRGAGVAPPVTAVSPLKEPPLEPEASDEASPTPKELAEEIWAMQPRPKGKRRTARPDVIRALNAALKRGGSPNDIRRSCRAYYALPDCTKAAGEFAMGAERLLECDRWKDFQPAERADQPATRPFPDAGIRAAIAIFRDEAWCASWLDPCTWDAERRVIIPRTNFAAAKLKQEVGPVLRELGVRIEERAAA